MEQLTAIPVQKIRTSKLAEADFENLEFGKYISDHMLICDYESGEWEQPQIMPFANFSISPAALALHYGQTVFEGMKAFRMIDGSINIFRLDKHYERFVKSLERMCMAVVPRDIFSESLMALVETDNAWVPNKPGTALYLRPFVIASEEKFGVKIADEYKFIIFTGPVPSLYAAPIKVKVETEFVRAAKGGTGFAKCGGNYGASFLPTRRAKEEGFDQVLWTDAREHRYIEESGMMNVMFVINNLLVTAPLSDSILDGVTRDSLLTIAKDLGYNTAERPVSVEELENALINGTLTEAFGAGTAAVVAPIKIISIHDKNHELPGYHPDNLCFKIKEQLEKVRTGAAPDLHGWNFIVNPLENAR